jgi:hypothetical protein
MLDIPILFIVFNRLETTKRVFDSIKAERPKRVFLAGDGPRAQDAEDAQRCRIVRQFVLGSIDWPCEVRTLFQERNLGCKYAVSGAIKWFFENVESGIVLEDDCLPSPSFFGFCERLLSVYKDDSRVGMISGHNYFGKSNRRKSYCFITTCGVWGWASWRRALVGYDADYSVLMNQEMRCVHTICFRENVSELLLQNGLRAARSEIDTWDYQLCEHFITNGMFTIIPSVNLVRNIGFRSDSTHTSSAPAWYRDTSYEIAHPVKIEKSVVVDRPLSRRVESLFIPRESVRRMAVRLVRRFL